MSKADPGNDVDTSGKCYNQPVNDGLETRDDFPVSANPARRHVTIDKEKEKTNSRYSEFQYRYVVTLFGFFVYFEINCYRIATSMSILKMVNNSALSIGKSLNSTIVSCPLYNSAIHELPNPDVEGEFNWSPEIQGYILSAGFLGYVVSQIPGGLLTEAYGAKTVIFSGVLMSSLAHMLCPFAAWCNCYLMITMQFLRGVGQGFLPPATSVISAKWFPRPDRGFLNSLIFTGSCVGSLVTYATSGALCSLTLLGGWPLVYFVYGGLGLMFVLCVHLFLYESPNGHPRIGKSELIYILENQECDLSQKKSPTPWQKILTSVPVYAMTYSIFSFFWTSAHLSSVHPIFLGNILHFPIRMNGILNSIPFAFQILFIFLGGWISRWLNTNGYAGVDKVRKGSTMLYSVGYSLALLGMYFAGCNRMYSNVWSVIAFSCVGLSMTGSLIVPIDMSPTFAGCLFAFSNTIASSASFVFPLIVGAMIEVEESLEQWEKIFLLCTAVGMSSGVLFSLFGSAEVQPWNFPSTGVVERNWSKDEGMKNGNKETVLFKDVSVHLLRGNDIKTLQILNCEEAAHVVT